MEKTYLVIQEPALERDYPVSGRTLTDMEKNHFYEILAQEGITHIIKG